MSIEEFRTEIEKIASGRKWSAKRATEDFLHSDGRNMTTVTWYGWIDGHRACVDFAAESVLAWLSKSLDDSTPFLRQV